MRKRSIGVQEWSRVSGGVHEDFSVREALQERVEI